MEPPGGLPPDRDRQLVLHAQHQHQQQQQQLVPVQVTKPNFTLNLPHQQQPQQKQQLQHATSPAPAASTSAASAATATTTQPALASTATAITATTAAATAFSGSSVAHHHVVHQPHHHPAPHPHPHQPHNNSSVGSSLLGGLSAATSSSGGGGGVVVAQHQQQTIDKLSRPQAFDKMEALVREMQDPENGVPVRQQKMFLTSIPYAFMGYDLIEWLMDRLLIEESEALNIANQLCLHGYFFPVNDTKTLVVKDDSSLYRFQTPYYWPWQHKAPDNVEYAIYLAKRSLRNKQRHALEDYEAEALASLHKNLKGKWDFISMQAEEQVRLAKERKKGDKIVGDSQERAYWRVHRPPPGQFTPLEPCPVPSRDRQGAKPNKKKTLEDVQREVDYLKKSLNRTRMKMSQACESLVAYSETFVEYDFFLQPVLPSNPWVTEDVTFWQLNNTFVDVPTEKRVKRWAISIEELVSDPTGLQEFTAFLEKEYSHENIRFWIAVNRLRRSAHSQVARKVNDIYEEFLKPGAPCEINIDGKTMESVLRGLSNPSRFTFDAASEHIYMLLLKKDCYPRFVRSEHYKRLLETGIQPSHKKRFFNFGGVGGAKKKMTAALSSQPNMGEGSSGGIGIGGPGGSGSGSGSGSAARGGPMAGGMMQVPPPGSLARRRGSDRSLTGSAHELAVIGVNKDVASKVPHSHSQSNLSEMPYSESVYRGDLPTRMVAMDAGVYAAYGVRGDSRCPATQDVPKPKLPSVATATRLETTVESAASAVCPWDLPDEPPQQPATAAQVQLSVCPWEQESGETTPVAATTPTPTPTAAAKPASQRLTSTSSDIGDVADRLQRSLGIRHQNTVDSGEASMKRLAPNFTEQRRASVSFTPSRISEYQVGRPASSILSSTPSPTVGGQSAVHTAFPPLYTPLASGRDVVSKDPPSSSSDADVEEELHKLSLAEGPPSAELPQTQPQPSPSPFATSASVSASVSASTSPPSPKFAPPSATIDTQTSDDDAQTRPREPQEMDPRPQPESEREREREREVVSEQVTELQIELIEATSLEDQSSRTQRLLERATVNLMEAMPKSATPMISVHECVVIAAEAPSASSVSGSASASATASGSNSNSNSPSPKVAAVASSSDLGTLEAGLNSRETSPQQLPTGGSVPPPLPPMGPMEEEDAYPDEDGSGGAQEELSPTTDEYQEGLQFGADSKDVYDYDIVDTDADLDAHARSHSGYIAPAPTPAPTLAPLAELDVDTVEDEPPEEEDEEEAREQMKEEEPRQSPVCVPENLAATTSAAAAPGAGAGAGASSEEVKRRRKKRNSDGKKMSSLEERDKDKDKEKASATEADRNTVCPWEDENVSASDGTFVKTYATLGYL